MSTIAGPFTIRQSTDASHYFDGTAPTAATPTVSGKLVSFAQETVNNGGLFNFASQLAGITFLDRGRGIIPVATMDLVILGYRLRLGAPATWSISTVDPDGKEVVIDDEVAAGDTDFAYTGEEFVLAAGNNLKVVTAAPSAVQTATISLVPYLYHRPSGR